MEIFDPQILKQLYLPSSSSHKGDNGKLLIIGGSHLFHAASLWSLTIASKIVDMVFYSSVPENNQLVLEAKKEFRNGIVVLRDDIERYLEEADCVLIGPGMMRADPTRIRNQESGIMGLAEINALEDEGEQAYWLTKYLLEKYPEKKWVIDAGALQMMEPEWLLGLNGNVIVTPHPGEFEKLELGIKNQELSKTIKHAALEKKVALFASEFRCTVLLKGEVDTVCSPLACVSIAGGNAGMTKGGTGDVLAGLVAALACKNDLFLAAQAGSYLNKEAGDSLFKKVGYYFNASDLADEIPRVMKELFLSSRT